MLQKQLTEMKPEETAGKRLVRIFLTFGAWLWGISSILLGAGYITKNALFGVLAIVLGVMMLPITRRVIDRVTGVRFLHPLAVGAAVLVVMMMIGRELSIEEKARMERLMKIEQERGRQDSVFIAQYPFVDRTELRAWRESAADSVTDSAHTMDAFLERQRVRHRRRVDDSIAAARKWHEDSIAAAWQWRRDSVTAAKDRRRDSLNRVREERRLAAERERRYAPELYNGHVVYTGPRGGRYYINSNGRKTYIR